MSSGRPFPIRLFVWSWLLVAAGLGHACIGRIAASRAIDPSLTWLEPHEATAPRTIAVSYPRHRPLTATARSLITAIRGQAA